MRLADSYLRSIVYLGFPHPETESGIDPIGTGFLLSYDEATYIVTAAHVAKELKDCPFGVRLNRTDDGIGQVERIESAVWYSHTDEKVDVAVMPFQPPRWARIKYIWGKYMMSEFKRGTKDFGVGDLAYVVGIFKAVRAKDKNVPVVHTGHVASMADGELLVTEDWRDGAKPHSLVEIEGYLVQAHTMRQASGSPVFVRRSISALTPDPDAKPIQVDEKNVAVPVLKSAVHGSVWLLGLWHGAWVQDISTLLKVAEGSVTVGTGMGICVPAPKIIEVLNRPALQAMRRAAKDAKERESAATPQAESPAVSQPRKQARKKRAKEITRSDL